MEGGIGQGREGVEENGSGEGQEDGNGRRIGLGGWITEENFYCRFLEVLP